KPAPQTSSGWNTPATTPPPARVDEALPLPLPGPEQPALDLTLLKDTSLCVFPFVKESAAGSSDKKYLEAIQKTFFDVAKDSPLLKDAIVLGDSTARSEPHDGACVSNAGRMARCQTVLVGSSASKGTGCALSVRLVGAGKQRVQAGRV